jgi:indole-3-glycerol phosphate synthase
VDSYQLYETVLAGGHGVILVACALSTGQAEDLHGLALELGLSSFLYVCGRDEAEMALRIGLADVIVGDGDLFSHESRKEAGAGPLEQVSGLLPASGIKLSLGGVTSLDAARRRQELGAHCVVVGRAYQTVVEALSRVE